MSKYSNPTHIFPTIIVSFDTTPTQMEINFQPNTLDTTIDNIISLYNLDTPIDIHTYSVFLIHQHNHIFSIFTINPH